MRSEKRRVCADTNVFLRLLLAILFIFLVALWCSRVSKTVINAPSGRLGGRSKHETIAIEIARDADAIAGLTKKAAVLSYTARDFARAHTSFSVGAEDKAVRTFTRRALSFRVCNGFANQRLSIVYAAIIAKETGRSLYLPRLLLDGTQNDTSKATTVINSEATDFGTFYDVEVFRKGMKTAGVRVLGKEFPAQLADKRVVRVPPQDLQSLLASSSSEKYKSAALLSVGCPIFKLDAAVVGRNQKLVESLLSSLIPAPDQRAEIDKLKFSLSKSGHYNFLHLRVERDWISHCKMWVSDRGNCLAEEIVRAIGEHLDLKGVSRGTPLHVACDLPAADPYLLHAAMRSLKAMGYKKVTLQCRNEKGKSKEGRKSPSGSKLSREVRAMHTYYLGMDSAKYIGNSVSTFSALLLLERQNRNRWSTYYNMGGIPLMDMLPFFRMPWVFT